MSPQGGSIAGVQILVSDGLPAGTKIVCVDAAQVAADIGRVTLDSSGHSSLVLDDVSTDQPGGQITVFGPKTSRH